MRHDTMTEQLTRTRRLECASDIAYAAGRAGYYGGDSRADLDTFMAWANAFEATPAANAKGNETYGGEPYMDAMELFIARKMEGQMGRLTAYERIEERG